MKDVLVVGSGPTGSHIASRLAGEGYDVVVLEKKDGLGGKVCCAGLISPECIGAFNIDDRAVLKRVNGARIFSPSGKSIRLWREEEQACIVDRADFDVYMAERAMEKGVEYIFGSDVRSIEVQGDRVSAGIAGNGAGIKVEARVAVIASGFGSKLTMGLGLGEAGDYVVGAQTEVEITDVDEIEVYTGRELAPGFFGWLMPIEGRRALAGLLTRRKAGLYLKKMIALLREKGKVASDSMEPSCRGITLKPPKKTYGRRVIVVGDAAGQVKPTTGGGIYFGLLSGEIAAEHLKKALEADDLSSRRLAEYEKEWKQRLGKELKICYWARRLFERLSDKKINNVFDIITEYGIDKALLKDGDVSFDWHGKAIVRLAGQKMVSRLSNIIRLPSWIGAER